MLKTEITIIYLKFWNHRRIADLYLENLPQKSTLNFKMN